MKRVLFLSGFFLLTLITYSQQTVSGTVKDETGSPVPDVTVTVKDSGAGTKTDDEGKYIITLPVGYKVLTFAKEGYKVREVEVVDKVINIVMSLDDFDLFNL